MNIVFITNLYQPYARGGAEEVVYQWASEAKKRGDQPMVISWRPWTGWRSWRPERVDEEGIVVYRYWVPNIGSYTALSRHSVLFKLLWHAIDICNFWSTQIVKSILKTEVPHEVQTHNLMGIGFGIPRMIQRQQLRHIHVLHDVQLVEPSGILPWNHERDSCVQKMYSAVMRWRMGTPDRVVSLSLFLKKFYTQRAFFSKSTWDTVTVPSVSVLTKFQPYTRFLFVGALEAHKGIHVLMQAWQSITKQHIKLDIVGDGSLRQVVDAWAAQDPRIRVHGRQSRDALRLIYHQCDALLFTSTCLENRPTVIMEALGHGLFIIAASSGGVSELFSKERGIHVPPGNAQALALTIEGLFQ